MRYELNIDMLENEKWWGGDIPNGALQPFSKDTKFENDNIINNSKNQSTPLFLSNMGRYIWSNDGYKTVFDNGKITCMSDTSPIELFEGFETLKGAYLDACRRFFPPNGKTPNKIMFEAPQYCTWIEMLNEPDEESIIGYAKSIIDKGLPAGVLIIDDGWQSDFGDWTFDKYSFDNPKSMVNRLHIMGFKVVVWICPFISKKSPAYKYLKSKDCLVRNKSGLVANRKWWNGKDFLLDLTNPMTKDWICSTLDSLKRDYGIDGFKFDGGDAFYYEYDDKTYAPATPNEQSLLWHDLASQYEYSELRACWKGAGDNVVQRLKDKPHSWEALQSLIPETILQGLSGYAFSCPDMIGGGWDVDFKSKKPVDEEILLRYSQCCALMPMMQFSYAIWNKSSKNIYQAVIKACRTHSKYAEYILELAEQASITGEPIIRHMEYEFPHQGYENVKEQFMLGDKYLVAPIVRQGQTKKAVTLPAGKWSRGGSIFIGGKDINFDINEESLLIFEMLEAPKPARKSSKSSKSTKKS